MGHALWTSPITGYRRKGTRFAELRDLIEAGITAHAILEPLQSCWTEAPAQEMARLLETRDFDLAGVQAEKDAPVIGFVERQSLKDGVVSDYMEPLSAEHLISDATPLLGTLSVLKARQHAFVLVGPEVKGIVTRADLNKPPLRIYLFGLVSLLEMHLAFWVRAEYPGDSWQGHLADGRLKAANKIQESRCSQNPECELRECLQLCDKRDLVLKRTQLCESLGLAPNAETQLKNAEKLRNLLAHGQENLVEGTSWEALIDLTEWIEMVLGKSDEQVESRAEKSKQEGLGDLWSSV
jgi:hypothetical protein